MKTAVQPTTPNHPSWLRLAAWVVAALTVGIILYWGFNRAPANAFDDAYITYRYADNLRSGLGLLYNPGEWVFGTTTPLFSLLLGGLGLIIADLELLGHWLGVIGWLAAGLLSIPLFRQENRPFAALVAPLLIALQPTFYTSLGMETPLLVALMVALPLFWLRGKGKTAVLLAALLILTRHDRALWLLLIGLEIGRRRRQSGQPLLNALPWREGVATLLLTLPWFIYALLRYGSPLPNSAAAKVGQTDLMPVAGQSPFGLALIEAFINRLPPLTLIFIAFLFVVALYLIFGRLRRFWWLLAWPILYAFFYTLVGVANFPWYYVPPVTLLLLLLALAVGSLFGDEDWQLRPSTSILISPFIWRGTALLGLLFFLTNLAVITADRQNAAGYRPSYLSAAHWLRENTPPEATVATIEIGIIGYHSNRPILDTQGLISRDMTDHQLGWDDTLVYALNAHQPDYAIVLPGTAWDSVISRWWFKESYKPVNQFSEATLYGRITPTPLPTETTFPANIALEGGLKIESLTVATSELIPGQPLTASLAISVSESPLLPLHIATYLVGSGTFEQYGNSNIIPFDNLYPSQHWQAGDRLNIPLLMTIPDDLPEGAYRFGLAFNDTDTDTALLQENQSSEIHLGLLRHGLPTIRSILPPDYNPVLQSWNNGISLILPRNFSISSQSTVQLQPIWQTTNIIAEDWTYFFHIINREGEIVAQLDQRPWNGRWPTTAWRPEERFQENLEINLPEDLPRGSYHLRIGFYTADEHLPLADSENEFIVVRNFLTIQP